MKKIGFDRDDEKEKKIYNSFYGKYGNFSVGNMSVPGVLKEVNFEKGYMKIQPSLVNCGEGEARLEEEQPTIVEIFPGDRISMHPLREEDLLKYAEKPKKKTRQKKKNLKKIRRMFFHDKKSL